MKQITAFVAFLLYFLPALAQVKEIKIGVNGLTCSQCSRTVELSIRKLPFVTDVKMNLEHTEGEIYVNNSKDIDMQKIAKAVVNAGFSVRYLEAEYNCSEVKINADGCTNLFGAQYVFLKNTMQMLNGKVILQFIGAQYQPRKDFKQWQPLLKNNCNTGQTPYYVTIKST